MIFSRRRLRRALVLIALPALAVFGGCSGDGESAARSPGAAPVATNIVLVVIDTLRADHLGCYGYARDTSPRIDRFAASATRFSRAMSSAPWTVPSHASMFTGKPPFLHGAHTFPVDGPDRKNVNPLPAEQLTIAEALRDRGYRTAAFVSNDGYLAKHWQLDQGFSEYHVERLPADEANTRILPWLDGATEPFFLFINYIDTHRPYNTRPRPGLVALPEESGPNALLDELVERVLPARDPVPVDLVRKVVAQYDTAIGNVDEQVGVLLAELDRRGLDETTLVVVTSDHGEYFGEHHLVEHSKDIYQEALHVPLIVRSPGQTAGTVSDTPVVSHDLPRLMLRALPPPLREELAGLFPGVPGAAPVLAENYYTRRKDLFNPVWGPRFNRVRRAVYDWPFKYIDSSDGAHELYDLDRDRTESTNLIEERSEIAARLAREIEALGTASSARDPDLAPVDEELQRKLEALGYVD